jgi:penicillin-binding protein 2
MVATSYLATPHVAKEINGKVLKPELKKIDFEPYYLSEIRKGMYDVCNIRGGTAFRTMSKLPIVVAGKTGTSQVTSIPQSTKKRLKESELAYFHRSHAWITTYAPYDNPQYIVTMLVEHGGHGGSTAGPMVADIYKWLYEHGYFKEKGIPIEMMDSNSSN